MGWISLLTAAFSFGAQLFKYLREKEEADKTCAAKLRRAGDAIKTARKSKDTSGIEHAFIELGLANNKFS